VRDTRRETSMPAGWPGLVGALIIAFLAVIVYVVLFQN
jgi:hypothetical protein